MTAFCRFDRAGCASARGLPPPCRAAISEGEGSGGLYSRTSHSIHEYSLGPNPRAHVFSTWLEAAALRAQERMNEDLVLAAQYREHAHELRRLARDERPTWANDALKKAADDYDHLAAALERAYVRAEPESAPPAVAP